MNEQTKYRLSEELPKHGGRLSSASQLYRTLTCPLSELLPHTADVPPWIKKAGSRGTALHKAMEHMGSLKAYEETAPQHHDEIAAINYDRAAGRFAQQHHREIKFRYDCLTGEVIHLLHEGDRNYGVLQPQHITCTVDVLITGFTNFEVWDYKSAKNCDKYLPCKTNPQLLMAALCAYRLVCPRASTITLGIQQLPGMDLWAEDVTPLCLLNFEARLQGSFVVAEDEAFDYEFGVMNPVPGKYCDLCPGRYECPKDEK